MKSKKIVTSILDGIIKELPLLNESYKVCGVLSVDGAVYPLSSDTKVLSTVFEILTRPVVYRIAKRNGLTVYEPSAQNHYPDFTLMRDESDKSKIAIDVKTTYRRSPGAKFSYTLGGYTSFIRPENERKNIAFPHSDYAGHIVIGFVYDRASTEKKEAQKVYRYADRGAIPLAFQNVEVFAQEKWRIAGCIAGSHNTTNIGSIKGEMADFVGGKGPFKSEEEFLEYWRNYEQKEADRTHKFNDIDSFRIWNRSRKP